MKILNELLKQKQLSLLDEDQLLQIKGGGDGDPPPYIDPDDDDDDD